MKSIWKCRPTVGRHFDVGFINQALLAKVSLLDKVSFCGTVKPQPRPENPTDTMKKMSIMANPIMSGDSLVFLTTAHNRAMSSHAPNRLSTDTCETHRYERMGTWFKRATSSTEARASCETARRFRDLREWLPKAFSTPRQDDSQSPPDRHVVVDEAMCCRNETLECLVHNRWLVLVDGLPRARMLDLAENCVFGQLQHGRAAHCGARTPRMHTMEPPVDTF